ncbi:unnamed protein product [Ambrosiozyma monospora]|uniref:Unnamed protein product n=1 Tax=Ambrosiozyma monospora TaxID=43982 RepID=A0ACB5SVZ0_AMBMO|nr:unnamed protein product [Ambrosiozyma monospora]
MGNITSNLGLKDTFQKARQLVLTQKEQKIFALSAKYESVSAHERPDGSAFMFTSHTDPSSIYNLVHQSFAYLRLPFLLKHDIAELLKDVPAKQDEVQVEVVVAVRVETEGIESIDVFPEQKMTSADGLRTRTPEQFADVVTEKKLSGLPPKRDVEHTTTCSYCYPFH